MSVQCFDTFRGFLHKLYAATMDGNGREVTNNFFLIATGGSLRVEHRAQGGSCPSAIPLVPPMRSLIITIAPTENHRNSAHVALSRNFPEFFSCHYFVSGGVRL